MAAEITDPKMDPGIILQNSHIVKWPSKHVYTYRLMLCSTLVREEASF